MEDQGTRNRHHNIAAVKQSATQVAPRATASCRDLLVVLAVAGRFLICCHARLKKGGGHEQAASEEFHPGDDRGRQQYPGDWQDWLCAGRAGSVVIDDEEAKRIDRVAERFGNVAHPEKKYHRLSDRDGSGDLAP